MFLITRSHDTGMMSAALLLYLGRFSGFATISREHFRSLQLDEMHNSTLALKKRNAITICSATKTTVLFRNVSNQKGAKERNTPVTTGKKEWEETIRNCEVNRSRFIISSKKCPCLLHPSANVLNVEPNPGNPADLASTNGLFYDWL